MAFNLSWLLHGRIVLASIYGTLTEQDDRTFDAQLSEFVNQTTGLPMHVITDYSRLEKIVTDIRPSQPTPTTAALAQNPALGRMITYGAHMNPMTRFLGSMSSYALKPSSYRFSSMEGAVAYLCDVDPTLPHTLLADGNRRYPRPA